MRTVRLLRTWVDRQTTLYEQINRNDLWLSTVDR